MYKLYHQPFCPFSRKVRILMAAKNIRFDLVRENFWERRKEFIAINTMGTVPVLFDSYNGSIVCGSSVIVEYIDEKYSDSKSFIGDSLIDKAEARRLQMWFDKKFYVEVSKYVTGERFFNRFLKIPIAPNSGNIVAAKNNLTTHFNYMEFLLENRRYLAGDQISIADFAAAAHISVLDYFGDVNWRNYNVVKEWYCMIKSQRFFSEILRDRVPNFIPSPHYSELDF